MALTKKGTVFIYEKLCSLVAWVLLLKDTICKSRGPDYCRPSFPLSNKNQRIVPGW